MNATAGRLGLTHTHYADAAGTLEVSSSSYAYDAAGQLISIQHRDATGNVIDDFYRTHPHKLESLPEDA